MTAIWVVELSKQSFSVAQCLIGDFPTRVFRSLDSFKKLSSLKISEMPNVVVVDCSQSDDITEFINFYSKKFSHVNLIILTEQASIGATIGNVIKKPIDPLSLTTIVRQSLQRTDLEKISFEDLVLHPRLNKIRVGAETADLTQREARILEFLIRNRERCVSRNEIANEVWINTKVSPRTIDSHISRLRQLISMSESVRLVGVYGKGYVLSKE